MPTPHTRDWIDVVTAFAPALAVMVALGVALMQYYLQRQQWKQNLYDKRFAVYWAGKDFTRRVLGTADWDTGESLHRFAFETGHSPYLFGPDVKAFFNEVRKMANEIHLLHLQQQHHLKTHEGTFPTNSQIAAIHSRLVNFMLLNDTEVFAPYLQLYQDQSWFARFIARTDRWVNEDKPAVMAARYDK